MQDTHPPQQHQRNPVMQPPTASASQDPTAPCPFPLAPASPHPVAAAAIENPLVAFTTIRGVQDGIAVDVCRVDVQPDTSLKGDKQLRKLPLPKAGFLDTKAILPVGEEDGNEQEMSPLTPQVVSETCMSQAVVFSTTDQAAPYHPPAYRPSPSKSGCPRSVDPDFALSLKPCSSSTLDDADATAAGATAGEGEQSPIRVVNLTPELPVPAPKTLWQKFWEFLKHLGPAFVVSVAYIDPGNFATNISAGVGFNYTLLWVILWSNMTAIYLQTLSAKVGIATGKNIPQLCSTHFSRRVNWLLWAVAGIAAMATDLAEFLGAVLGFFLLAHVPKWGGAAITVVITMGLVMLKGRGQRYIEFCIGMLVAVVTVTYFIQLFLCHANWPQVFLHTALPMFTSPVVSAVMIAIGMLGATVMPHAIFLHSDLVQHRGHSDDTPKQRRHHLKLEKGEIAIAMNVAFVVNASMVVVSAAAFYDPRSPGGDISIEDAYSGLTPLLGALASYVFGAALLASGLSSSAVGTLAGEVVLNGFVNLRIPLLARRVITMTPGVIIIAVGVSFMDALVYSQVVLSFCLPFAIIPLLLLTNSIPLMGELANDRLTKYAGCFIAAVVILFNAFLVLAFVLQLCDVNLG